MRYLLVDTADVRGFVSLCENERSLHLTVHPADQDYSSWLLPASGELLRRAGLSLSALDAYAVCSGPGSFTGLRVGLTTVKAWASIYAKPIAALSRLSALGSIPVEPNSSSFDFVAAYIDAQRGQVFASLYSPGAQQPIEAESVIALPAFVEIVGRPSDGRPVLWRTPDPDLLRSLPQWQSRKATGDLLQEVVAPFAAPLAQLALKKLNRGEITDALSLDANYIRRSDAEIFWKGNSSVAKV